MKNVVILSLFLLSSLCAIAQKTNSSENSQNNKKADGQTQDTRYQEGASGVKRSISYKFSTIITDEDPGIGIFRYNNDSLSDITYIFVDVNDLSGEDQTKWYSTWDDTTGATGRGRINIVEYEGQNVNIFDVSGVFIKESGYWKIPVKYISGALPANGATYYYVFERIENKDKTAKSEKEESDKKAAEVIAAGTVAVAVTETKVENTPVPVVEERKVEEVKAEVIVPADTVKQEVKEEKAAEVATAVIAAAAVVESKPENPPLQVVEEQKAEEIKAEVIVPADTVKQEVKEGKATEVAAAVTAVTVAAVVTEPKADSQPVQVIEEKKTEVAKEETVPPSEPVKQDAKEEKVAESAEVVAVATVVSEPKADSQSVQEVKETPVQQTETVKQPEPVKQEVKEEKVAETAVAVAVTTVVAVPKTDGQQVQVIQEPKTEEKKAAEVTVATKVTQTNEVKQPVQTNQETQSTSQSQTTQSTTQKAPASQTQTTQQKQDTQVSQSTQGANQTKQTTQTNPVPQTSQGSTVSKGYSLSKRSDGTRIWHGIIETGYGFKAGEYGLNNYRIHFISSFSLGQYFMIGLGIGYRSYSDKADKHPDWYMVSNKSQIPVFLDLRAVLSKKKLAPFIALGLGSSTEKSSSDTTSYGSFVNPSAGIWYRISKNTAIFADIAYEMQQLEFAKFSDNIPYKKNSGSISLNIGIQF